MCALKPKFSCFWIKIGTKSAVLLVLGFALLPKSAESNPLLHMADSLAARGHYDAAITEYLRYQFFHPDDATVQVPLARAYHNAGDLPRAIDTLRAAIRSTEEAIQHDELTLLLAQWYIEYHHEALAQVALYRLIADAPAPELQRQVRLMLFLIHLQNGEWDAAQTALAKLHLPDPSIAAARDTLIALLDHAPNPKSVSTARWMSTFVPGSGQLYAHAYRDGINALVLNGLLGWQTGLFLADKQYVEALVLGQFVLWRYYSGNRYHAARLTREYNRGQTRQFQQRLLDKARLLFLAP